MNLTNCRVVVTGGSGFLGFHVVEELNNRGCESVIAPRSDDYDLRNRAAVDRLYDDADPDCVIHIAGTVGGIGVMDDHAGELFYDNLKMALELIEAGRLHDLDKFVTVGSVCAYPKHTSVPFDEKNIWEGLPEETHAPYGIAKRVPLMQTLAYDDQYDFDGIYLLPTNLYGPGDDFDIETSHVIPALIRKTDRAIREGSDSITVWGTGEPTREFLYVTDAATGIVKATVSYNSPDPVNLGTGEEITILGLAELIVDKMGFDGEIELDESKPDGQPRRCLSVSQAEREFGWTASTDLETGIEKTIEWYLDNREQIVNPDED